MSEFHTLDFNLDAVPIAVFKYLVCPRGKAVFP